jgi:AP-1 complex subunit gamma-1
MSIKLRDLIRAVRACKTAAEERAVISKECALIRTAIKEEDEQFRQRNVAKLLFIHMLGYPTHFGQMECLKLISAQSFPEKRVGYLGLTLLLTEQTEVLTLVTNCLKIDLSNSNQYIQALSLVAIGNLATQDMARDLVSDVEKLLRSNNSYLRKKAALATIRLLKREPDLIEGMGDRIVALLKDRSHGVLITGIQLVIEVLSTIPETREEYVKLVPSLTRLLRNFLSMGFSPEHDVSGITDPFMQVKILRLLRLLGKGSDEASEQMNDVLAQVATNTETTKNAGNAILYECVQTIMEVESDSSLRVLAVNILGRFLLNRDNNIRYVALNSLATVVSEDIVAVQRHRTTIVDCLKDPDVSIRQRALELIYQLVNEQNVVALTTELLNYLVVAQTEHKPNLVSKVIQIVEKYSPNKKWRVDTVITMLSIAGNIADESVPRTAIIFIAQADGLHGFATHRLFRCLQEDAAQLGLLQVAIWCIGEYGALLLHDCPAPDNDSNTQSFAATTEEEVVRLLEKCSKHHNADIAIKALVLNALMKLTVRFSGSITPYIIEFIAPFRHSMSLELQQRSLEYSVLLGGQWGELRKNLLEKMPVLDDAEIRKRRAAFDDGTFSDSSSPKPLSAAAVSMPSASSFDALGGVTFNQTAQSNGGSSLLDLDDIFGSGKPMAPVTNYSQGATSPVVHATAASGQDLLSQIFSSPMPASNALPLAPQSVFNINNLPVTSLMPPAAAMSHMMIATAKPSSSCSLSAFDKAGLQVTNSGNSMITLYMTLRARLDKLGGCEGQPY